MRSRRGRKAPVWLGRGRIIRDQVKKRAGLFAGKNRQMRAQAAAWAD
jgi:hypothetical protein